MDKSTKNKLLIYTAAVAGIFFIVLYLLIHLLSGGTQVETMNGYTIYHPSVARSANLGLNFLKFFLMIVGSLIFGYAIASGVTDTQFGSNDKQALGISVAELLGGAGLFLGIYLGSAYDIQTFTHITEKDSSITHKNSDFKQKFEQDPNPEFYKAAHGVAE